MIRYKRKSSTFKDKKHIQQLFQIRLEKQGYKPNEVKKHMRFTGKRVNKYTRDGESRRPKFIKIKNNRATILNKTTKIIINKYNRLNANIVTVHKNDLKLKQILLTKYRLHKKIGNIIQ